MQQRLRNPRDGTDLENHLGKLKGPLKENKQEIVFPKNKNLRRLQSPLSSTKIMGSVECFSPIMRQVRVKS